MAERKAAMETESIRHILSLLRIGGQSHTVLVRPAAESLAPRGEPDPFSSERQELSKEFLAPWYACLWLEHGQVSHCELFSEQGNRLLVGAQAMNFLEQSGRLRWQVVDPSTVPLPQAVQPGMGPPAWRPTRTARGESMMRNLTQLPRDYRRLLTLSNGQYTVEDLNRLLGPAKAEDFTKMLRTLKDAKLIE